MFWGAVSTGWRFGRAVDHRWVDYGGTPTDLDRFKYGYDYAGNRKWRQVTTPALVYHDEFYKYDGLHRLTNFQRSDLRSNRGQSAFRR